MKRVFFLVNRLDEFNFFEYIEKYLNGVSVTVGDSLPKHANEYDLIVLWSYRKIIRDVSSKNIILFHSTNLPEGKGWAPIYYSISLGRKYFTISGILADEKIDSGDVIVKAKFKIKDNYTAEYIRKWDDEISIMLVKKILGKFANKKIKGKKQVGVGTTNPRRKPDDNEIELKSRLGEKINHLRACEKNHPAFFYYKKIKYNITIEPEQKPEFPSDLKITFYDST
jgi:methionyl-tRNA formyltransferase